MLEDLLRSRRETVGQRWLELVLATYPAEATSFLSLQENRFANPVGQTTTHGLRALLDEFLDGMEPERVCAHLDELMKIRAVQKFSPSEAVRIVYHLKDAIREAVNDALDTPQAWAELRDLESRVDQLALFTFDVYVMCREKVFSLRLNEIRKGYVNPA